MRLTKLVHHRMARRVWTDLEATGEGAFAKDAHARRPFLDAALLDQLAQKRLHVRAGGTEVRRPRCERHSPARHGPQPSSNCLLRLQHHYLRSSSISCSASLPWRMGVCLSSLSLMPHLNAEALSHNFGTDRACNSCAHHATFHGHTQLSQRTKTNSAFGLAGSHISACPCAGRARARSGPACRLPRYQP